MSTSHYTEWRCFAHNKDVKYKRIKCLSFLAHFYHHIFFMCHFLADNFKTNSDRRQPERVKEVDLVEDMIVMLTEGIQTL